MKKTVVILLLVFLPFLVWSQSKRELEEFARKQEQEREQLKQEQKKGLSDLLAEYEKYVKAEQEAYAAFKKQVEKEWGKGNAVESTNKDWVEYSDDHKSRTVVDFEKGEAKIEIIVGGNEVQDTGELKRKLEEEVTRLMENRGTSKDYDTEYEKRRQLSEEPVLAGQVETPEGGKISKENLPEAVKEIVEKGEPKIEKVKGEDGEEREVVVFSLPLAPDHIRVRAKRYETEVENFCRKYSFDPALVYAVIHTESYFNPKAKSYVPAYGLMQIVPHYAGKDAYRYVYGKDKRPTANYLYEPHNNVELGTAYLHLLYTRSFQQVKDSKSRMLCVIAAYNTGAGNVSRAFTGNTRLSNAISKINSYSYEDLYAYLSKRLPAQETRDYIRKVTERMQQYKEWR
ncbi:murein transglycosylase domain-containing protein [Odoribacter laneus]|uniref:murein transglycosylase domain-containing protein n=1 Tax=Odoribacter laneus TaxID=626933 RepID=UPI003FED8317